MVAKKTIVEQEMRVLVPSLISGFEKLCSVQQMHIALVHSYGHLRMKEKDFFLSVCVFHFFRRLLSCLAMNT